MQHLEVSNAVRHIYVIRRLKVKCSRQWHTYSAVNPEDGGNIFLRSLGSHVKFVRKIVFLLQHNT